MQVKKRFENWASRKRNCCEGGEWLSLACGVFLKKKYCYVILKRLSFEISIAAYFYPTRLVMQAAVR